MLTFSSKLLSENSSRFWRHFCLSSLRILAPKLWVNFVFPFCHRIAKIRNFDIKISTAYLKSLQEMKCLIFNFLKLIDSLFWFSDSSKKWSYLIALMLGSYIFEFVWLWRRYWKYKNKFKWEACQLGFSLTDIAQSKFMRVHRKLKGNG